MVENCKWIKQKMERSGAMKVCHVVHWPKSGITSVVRDLIRCMAEHGVESTVVLLIGDDTDILYFKDADSIHILDVSSGYLKAVSHFRKVVRQLKPDVLHVHSFTPLLMTYFSGFSGRRLISTVHSDYPYFTKRDFKSFFKRALFYVASKRKRVATVAVADHVAELIKISYSNKIDVQVINNGVPSESNSSIDQCLRNKILDLSKGKNIYVTVGRLSPEKNYRALIKAFASFKHKDECILLVVGDGSELNDLKLLSRHLGCCNEVIFTGYVENPSWVIDLADLFICSSLHEGFPLVILEAMRAQKPILSTPVMAAQSFAKHGCLKLIGGFESDDITESLSSYYVMNDLAGVAEKASMVFEAEFTSEVMAHKYMVLYENDGWSSSK